MCASSTTIVGVWQCNDVNGSISHSFSSLISASLSSAAPGIPATVSALLASSLETLIPAELSLETFNNVFIQQHSSSALAIFAAARASQLLGTPDEMVENLTFGVLAVDVQSDVKVRKLYINSCCLLNLCF